jgi:hypothetical protein
MNLGCLALTLGTQQSSPSQSIMEFESKILEQVE